MAVTRSASGNVTEVSTELHRRALAGDSAAFWRLVAPFQRLVYSVAWGILHDQERTEDVVQDTWVRAWTTLDTLREPDKLSGWLYSIARNVAYETIRATDRQHRIAEKAPMEVGYDHSETLAADEQHQLLHVALSRLPEQHRTVLAMKYLQDASCKEIADALGIGMEAAKSRLFEARKLLKARMETLEKHGWKHHLASGEGEHHS
jgi:RNA polymerase sigma-70 factor (ECF subfamily)